MCIRDRDYPFNLKGILYFPKINNEYDTIEGTIKLYNNRVFIADNIKEVIPEYLLLLKGVIAVSYTHLSVVIFFPAVRKIVFCIGNLILRIGDLRFCVGNLVSGVGQL